MPRPESMDLKDRIKQHLSLHWFLWLLAIACFLIAWNRGLALLYGMLALLLAVLAMSYVYPLWHLRGVAVSRPRQAEAQVGGILHLRYTLTHRHNAYHIELTDELPFAVEEEHPGHFLSHLPKHAELEVPVTCRQRGTFTLSRLRLACAYPFGVFRYRKTLETRPQEVTILPRTVAIGAPPMLTSRQQSADGIIQTTGIGAQHEFAGAREYRDGDSLRHIHWAASARHQELVVKEYEDQDRPSLLVVLDQSTAANIGEAPETTFETAITLCASVIRHAMEAGVSVHVMGRGQRETCFSVPSHCRDIRPYLERLAHANADGPDDEAAYPALVQEALASFPQTNTLMTFRNRSQSRTIEPPPGVTLLDMELVDESFIYPLRRFEQSWGDRRNNSVTYSITRNTALEGLFR